MPSTHIDHCDTDDEDEDHNDGASPKPDKVPRPPDSDEPFEDPILGNPGVPTTAIPPLDNFEQLYEDTSGDEPDFSGMLTEECENPEPLEAQSATEYSL